MNRKSVHVKIKVTYLMQKICLKDDVLKKNLCSSKYIYINIIHLI